MSWTTTHIGIGIIIAEILLRLIDDDSEFRKGNRFKFWWAGALGGLAPDLDVIPALILGVHNYTFHHYYTHTFLAVAIIFAILAIKKFNPYLLAFFLGFVLHLTFDFLDNSISPLGPFDIILNGQYIEWGLLTGGFQPMPCIGGVCGWASEFWFYPEYANHDLWTIFLNNGWGLENSIEFMSAYDVAFSIVCLPLILVLLVGSLKKLITRG